MSNNVYLAIAARLYVGRGLGIVGSSCDRIARAVGNPNTFLPQRAQSTQSEIQKL